MHKKIILISVFFVLSIFSFLINNKEKHHIISTMSVPVTNKIIVIDAGHGGEDERSCLLTLKITLIFYKK